MVSINKFLAFLASPSQSGDSTGTQAVVGLIALVTLVWGLRELLQWKDIDGRKKTRYIFIAAVASIILITSILRVYQEAAQKIIARKQETSVASSSLGFTTQHGTSTLSGWDNPVSGCATTAANPKYNSTQNPK